ncbi:MAG: hypothetical protein NUV81_00650 [bacterium]|nr:hypothetical protein [bacterium]
MSSPNLAHIYIRSWRYVTLVTLAGVVLAVGFSLLQPLKYSSTVRLLITQTNVTGVDPYTAVKSTERIAQNLGQVILTTSFYNAVVADTSVDKSYFPEDEIKRRTLWQNTIETQVSAGTGVMSVIAYHTSREQATNIAIRVAQEIANQAPNYFGYAVRVQIIDDPLPSQFFAKPDFMRNGLFGAVLGFLASSVWVLGRVKG